MTVEQIIKLGEMGYTAEEIKALEDTPAPEETIQEPIQSDVPEKTTPEQDPNIAALTAAVQELQKSVKSMQKMNLQNALQTEAPKRRTADDVIRDFFAKM